MAIRLQLLTPGSRHSNCLVLFSFALILATLARTKTSFTMAQLSWDDVGSGMIESSFFT